MSSRDSGITLFVTLLVAYSLFSAGCGGTQPSNPSISPASNANSNQQSHKTIKPSPAQPDVSGISPNFGPAAGGTAVTISGTNFQVGALVAFGSTPATVLGVTANSINCIVPPGQAGSVAVTVNNTNGTSGSLAIGFTYQALATSTTIPATLFSMQVNKRTSWPLQIPYRGSRLWDSAGGAQWPSIQQCNATASQCQSDPTKNVTWKWGAMDNYLSQLYQAGTTDNVMLTMSRTPGWAVDLAADPTGQNGTECDYYRVGSTDPGRAPGQCLPPVDLNADGSGTNAIWKAWVTQVAQHVNNSTYLQTHAHIKYWEACNECYRSRIMSSYSGSLAAEFTFAQLLRMVEDARCIITGKGTIHNYPSRGQSIPCSSSAIDPNAQIVMPAAGSGYASGRNWGANFLYCNQSPPPGSSCTWGNTANWGSAAVDVINTHGSGNAGTPESAYTYHWPAFWNLLTASDKAKPRMCGECSYNDPAKNWQDAYDQAAFIPRWLALESSFGISLNHWYAYDTDSDGGILSTATSTLLQPLATTWTLVYNALNGATPAQTPFCQSSGTVWTCRFTKANGYIGALVWDSQYGPLGTTAPAHCGSAADPIICGMTRYSVDVTTYNADYRTMDNVSYSPTAVITIGAVPVLLEGQTTY